jgi:hypothetical protein
MQFLPRRHGADLARRKPGVQIPSPPPPIAAGQSVASVQSAALTACWGRAAAASSSHTAAQRPSEASRPRPGHHTMTTRRGHRQLPPRWAILAPIPSLSRSATRSTGPSANHLPRRRPSQAVRLPAPPPPRNLIAVGHRGRRNAQTPDAGHRTPSPGQAPVGHRTLAPDTVTTAQPASGPPWPPRRATAR